MNHGGPGQGWRTPWLAPLLTSRWISWAVHGVVAGQLSLVLTGQAGLGCPFRWATGLLCPGCGPTEGLVLLLHGEWSRALQANALTPVFAGALVVTLAAGWLPATARRKWAERLIRREERWGLGAIGALLLLIWWVARLAWR